MPTPTAEPLANGLGEVRPKSAKQLVDDTLLWIQNHPMEATLLGAAGGVLIGLTGAGRIYRGVRAVRSMPLVSQFVLGAVVNGLLAKNHGPTESMH